MAKSKKRKGRPKPKANTAARPAGIPRLEGTDPTYETSTPVPENHAGAENPAEPEKQINCHYVPQWVLRKFSQQAMDGSKDDRPKVHYYDVETGKLTLRAVRDVYAKKGLYKDPNNSPGVDNNEIEKGIAWLEDKASRTLRYINNALAKRDMKMKGAATLGPTSFKIQREYLEHLRKLMFVMYFHQISIGDTFFDEDHPDNAKLRAWIRAYRGRNHLSASPQDTWLHVLRYYLRTKHNDIIQQGQEAETKIMLASLPNYGRTAVTEEGLRDWEAKCRSMEIDPNLEGWECLSYCNNMQMFLAIWEAAPGEEFVMSDVSFGLYEGRTESTGPLHKFYIVSPRIALVLCHPGLKEVGHLTGFVNVLNPWQLDDEGRSMSMLLDAPHKAAKVQYVNKKQPPSNRNILYGNPGAFYPSPKDMFEFEISPLSAKATHTVNAIILGNVKDNGKVTFGSKTAVLRTLDKFGNNKEFDHERKLKFASLAKELLETVRGPPNFDLGRFEPIPETIASRYLSSLSPTPGTFWEASLAIYHMLHEGNDPQCIAYRMWEEAHIQRWQRGGSMEIKSRPAQLVRKMDDRLACLIFKTCSYLMLQVFEPTSLNQEMFLEQLCIGLLEYLLEHQRSFFDRIEGMVIGSLLRTPGGSELARTARIKEYIELPEDVSIAMGGFISTNECEAPKEFPTTSGPATTNASKAFGQAEDLSQTTVMSEPISHSNFTSLSETTGLNGPTTIDEPTSTKGSGVMSEPSVVGEVMPINEPMCLRGSMALGRVIALGRPTSVNKPIPTSESWATREESAVNRPRTISNTIPLNEPMGLSETTTLAKARTRSDPTSTYEPTALVGTISVDDSEMDSELTEPHKNPRENLTEARPKPTLLVKGFLAVFLLIFYFTAIVVTVMIEVVTFLFKPLLMGALPTRDFLFRSEGSRGGRFLISDAWCGFILVCILLAIIYAAIVAFMSFAFTEVLASFFFTLYNDTDGDLVLEVLRVLVSVAGLMIGSQETHML